MGVDLFLSRSPRFQTSHVGISYVCKNMRVFFSKICRVQGKPRVPVTPVKRCDQVVEDRYVVGTDPGSQTPCLTYNHQNLFIYLILFKV